MSDAVNHPAHYTAGKYETIDVIEDSINAREHVLPAVVLALVWQLLKYGLRAGLKDGREGAIRDLRKAAWYATRAADALQRPLCDSCAKAGRGNGCEWPQSGVQSCGQYQKGETAWACPWCGGTDTWFDRSETVDTDGSVSGMETRCTQCGHATDDVPEKTDQEGEA
jgi:hypothetical protein